MSLVGDRIRRVRGHPPERGVEHQARTLKRVQPSVPRDEDVVLAVALHLHHEIHVLAVGVSAELALLVHVLPSDAVHDGALVGRLRVRAQEPKAALAATFFVVDARHDVANGHHQGLAPAACLEHRLDQRHEAGPVTLRQPFQVQLGAPMDDVRGVVAVLGRGRPGARDEHRRAVADEGGEVAVVAARGGERFHVGAHLGADALPLRSGKGVHVATELVERRVGRRFLLLELAVAAGGAALGRNDRRARHAHRGRVDVGLRLLSGRGLGLRFLRCVVLLGTGGVQKAVAERRVKLGVARAAHRFPGVLERVVGA
mmetsp:Transcript_25417/g.78459  ORF Transcript_25417/g.78459 Transcript_25417/m.78459 type:complete len:314 (+) Transcript_25417:1709-2650(+)